MFKKRMQKTHPNIYSFIDSIENEVHAVHNLISQINSGMTPREKKINPKLSNEDLKNYIVVSIKERLLSKNCYISFLFLLQMKNNHKFTRYNKQIPDLHYLSTVSLFYTERIF